MPRRTRLAQSAVGQVTRTLIPWSAHHMRPTKAKRRASSSRRRTYRGGGEWPEVGRPPSGGVSLEPEGGSGPTYGESDHEFLIGAARRRQLISGEVETMQLWLDGSQCKWLVNLKRKAWALKDVAFTQERDGAALAEHVRDGVLRLPDAGHYLQKDAHKCIVLALIEHLRR